ncbi:MAG TPA: PAS domain-containing protein [Actinomycetota bacterium]|nr:PAS domain-containing protein [Actinomycetota bacterium]
MPDGGRAPSLTLILARDLAASLATPVFIVDAAGDLVFFNEAAEEVLGTTFAEHQVMSREEWAAAFRPRDEEGRALGVEDLPLGVVLAERRPAHRTIRIVGGDGVARRIEVTAVPLYARPDEFVGGIALFWETPAGP